MLTVVSTAGRKVAIARLLSPAPLDRIARALERRRRPVVIVNLHSVPPRHAHDFRELLRRLSDRFMIGDPATLEDVVRVGADRPTLFFSFDDGLANHAEVAAPLLEEHGARAIFCLPVDFLDAAADEQLSWFRRHVYPLVTELHGDDDVRAMTWDQARELADAGHRIASHGSAHVELRDGVLDETLQREIVHSRSVLAASLPGVDADGFCWPVRVDPSARRAELLVRDTYAYSLGDPPHRRSSPHALHPIGRLNLEVSWPWSVVELQLARAALRG